MDHQRLDETVQGLWRVLLRMVPRGKRDDARAVANVLHALFEERAIAVGETEFRAGVRRGREAVTERLEEERRQAARLEHMPCPSDRPPTVDDELEQLTAATLRDRAAKRTTAH